MVTNSSKVVLEYVKRIMFGILTINYCIIDRRPDLKDYHNLRKYIHVTTVYFFWLPVFESESMAITIGSFKDNFSLEDDSKDKTLEHIEDEYKQIYTKDFTLEG